MAPRPALAGGDGTSSGKAAAATEPSASASYGPDGRASLRQRLWCSSSCGGKEPRFAGIGPSWRGRVEWLVTPQPENFRALGRPSRTGCLPPSRQQLRPCEAGGLVRGRSYDCPWTPDAGSGRAFLSLGPKRPPPARTVAWRMSDEDR